MTREEALEELKEIRFNLNYKVNGTSRFDKALDMAIDIMQQYVTDPVDRVTIKEYLEYTCGNRVQHGQWIFVDEAHEHARCSNCGYGDVDLFDGKPHNYCQNCGRKMQEVER